MVPCFEDFGIDLDSQLMSGTTDFKNREDIQLDLETISDLEKALDGNFGIDQSSQLTSRATDFTKQEDTLQIFDDMAPCFEDFGIDLNSQLMSGTTDFKNREDIQLDFETISDLREGTRWKLWHGPGLTAYE